MLFLLLHGNSGKRYLGQKKNRILISPLHILPLFKSHSYFWKAICKKKKKKGLVLSSALQKIEIRKANILPHKPPCQTSQNGIWSVHLGQAKLITIITGIALMLLILETNNFWNLATLVFICFSFNRKWLR